MKIYKKDWLTFKPKNWNILIKFRTFCDFESLNTSVEDALEKWKTRKIHNQKPVAPGYRISAGLPIVLKPVCHEYFGNNNNQRFVDEKLKLEKKWNITLITQIFL